MSCLSNVTALYQMIGQGQSKEALEKFYAEDCVVIEANGEVREGKEAQRKAVQQWAENMEEFHGNGVSSITANEETGITAVESWFDVKLKGAPRMKMEEVGVQTWKDGKIIKERFYYNIPSM